MNNLNVRVPSYMRTINTYKTVVIFRKFKDDGSIIALFPHEVADLEGNCSSYMQLGQHSAADYAHCLLLTVPAMPHEYAPLKRELEAIGYNLSVKKKRFL